MPNQKSATLVQVAQRAGVSLTTASKAINAQDRISASTRERVMKAARELSYTPNQHARSLITGRTRTVGVIIVDSLSHRFGVPVMLGAESALDTFDLSVVLADARGQTARCRELAVMLARRRVDGILVIGDDNNLTPSVTSLVDVPVVYVYGESDRGRDTMQLPDDEAGGALVAEHLIGLGRRRIGHLTGPREATAVQRRVTGVRTAMQKASLRIAGGARYGRWSQRWGYAAGGRLLQDRPDIDAVICGSDQIAAGVAHAVRQAGRRIPQDVAITGYDNWSVFTEESDPPLTSVEINLEQLGEAAAQDLFRAMDGTAARRGGIERVAPTLVVRGSSVTSR